MPTRIFGIGMHKTGTTSLDAAFCILGFKSAHWPSANWAKTVWREMTREGKSVTLEKHYAAFQAPIAATMPKCWNTSRTAEAIYW